MGLNLKYYSEQNKIKAPYLDFKKSAFFLSCIIKLELTLVRIYKNVRFID